MASAVEEGDKEEKEYVLLEFEDGWLPNSNTRFSLSGLGTMNPILVLEDGTKMVGHYEDTVGTCILFAEDEEGRVKIDHETRVRRKELGVDSNPNPLFVRSFSKEEQSKPREVEPVCALHKRLMFRVVESDAPVRKFTS
ncbi:hypothetical protein GOP47_0019809 [Adiantum capillus-veneris]|uniref:Transcription factor TFIIIC triple barrel domain-containing protein n=1 Tax=Adiantum capillus-veneris TaxID=13818 RepID=A0A9D4UD79_ADICA|nr:hypothetical protein GOP47_0019809 [Adiantum capillus-veneris]